jgi:hypothetical protein
MYFLSPNSGEQNYNSLICDLFVSSQFFCVFSSLYLCCVIYKDTEFWLLIDSYMLLFLFLKTIYASLSYSFNMPST